jgi:hypothetical protein
MLHFTKEHIVDNLESIGINLGKGALEVNKTGEKINSRDVVCNANQGSDDEISRIFDLEEKELAEEEEVDKLILNSLCCELMDEVMNLDSAYPLNCKTSPEKITCVHTKRVGQTKKLNTIVPNERNFLEYSLVERPSKE